MPCEKCGQVDQGQTGEYACSACGLPTLHDGSVRCAECRYPTDKHTIDCSQITIEELRAFAKRARYLFVQRCHSQSVIRKIDRKLIATWQSKFHTVRHENNKLRKANRQLRARLEVKDELTPMNVIKSLIIPMIVVGALGSLCGAGLSVFLGNPDGITAVIGVICFAIGALVTLLVWMREMQRLNQ